MASAEERGEFGQVMARVRKNRQLSQAELGRRIGGVVQATISSWETGVTEPRPDQVFAIEEALQATPGELSRLLGYVPVSIHLHMVHLEAQMREIIGRTRIIGQQVADHINGHGSAAL